MDRATFYGTPYGIFPVGKYKILWSPQVGDLYDTLFNMGDEAYIFINYLKSRESERERNLEIRWKTFLPGYKEKKYNDDFEKFKSTIVNYMDTLKKKMRDVVSTYKFIDASNLDRIPEDKELMLLCDKYIGVQEKFVGDTLIAMKQII